MTPRRPRFASLGISSVGNCDASSHSITCGRISDSANSRTVRRSCCCSSVKEKSTREPRKLTNPFYTASSATSVEQGREYLIRYGKALRRKPQAFALHLEKPALLQRLNSGPYRPLITL